MIVKCQICLEDPKPNPSVVTKCGHIYCHECLNTWMACSHSIRSCPICKRQLKKEDFRELTSEVCSICQSKPKFPILTTSGSLSCWACHYKTQCDQGLEPSQIIPIYGTEEETEDAADPAVPPRPVLQPGDSATTVVESRSRDSDQSTHVVQIDETEDIANNEVFQKVASSFACISQILLCLRMIAMLHLTLWVWDQDNAHKAVEGSSFIGGLLAIIAITAITWMKPKPAEKKMNAFVACFFFEYIISFLNGFWIMWTDKKVRNLELFPEYHNWAEKTFFFASVLACFVLPTPILSMANFRHHHLFRSCTAQMIIGWVIQLSSALSIYIIDGHLPPNWWYFTLGGNLLTLISLTFLVMSVFCKRKTLSILSSLVYLITAGVMIFKFVIFAMDVDVDIENIPMDGMLEANTVELFGHLICGTAHLSVMFGRWKLF